jgi:glycogen phosphorylase
VGEGFALAATVRLGRALPEGRGVEAYFGPLDASRESGAGARWRSPSSAPAEDGRHRYVGTIPCERSGMQGYTVRVRPSHPEACDLLGTGLVTWWGA